jgi:lysozyme family protein
MMAADNFDACLKFVLQFEGGFVNHPDDPGGPTNLGITIGTLSLVLGRPATIAEVKKLTPATVAPIYRLRFWNRAGGDELPEGVDLAVFDFGVHSGTGRAAMALQRVLGVADDGKIGDVTIKAAAKADPAAMIATLCADRLAFLKRLKVFKKMGKGLKSRVEKCEKAANSMVSAGAGTSAGKARSRKTSSQPEGEV